MGLVALLHLILIDVKYMEMMKIVNIKKLMMKMVMMNLVEI